MKIKWNKVTWYSKMLALALIVITIGLAAYLGYQYGKTVGATPVIPPPFTLIFREYSFINTNWVPTDGSDAVVSFLNTQDNDPKHLSYDYKIAADSRFQEQGYWRVEDGKIYMSPTKVFATAQNVKVVIPQGHELLFYSLNNDLPIPLTKLIE